MIIRPFGSVPEVFSSPARSVDGANGDTPPETTRGGPCLAIYGGPGVGKSELAGRLSRRLGWDVISSGQIAHSVDPTTIGTGRLAVEADFQRAFREAIQSTPRPFIVDGAPRRLGQVGFFPFGTLFLFIICDAATVERRLLVRGRADDNRLVIRRRMAQQVESFGSWARVIANRVEDTSSASPDALAEGIYKWVVRS